MVREFSTRVAGIYFSRGTVNGISNGDVLRLVREPHNPHDINAIRVEMPDGTLLGRIPRIVALTLAQEMDSGLKAYAIVQWTSPGHAGSAPHYGRGGRTRTAAVKASPPECQISVKIGDGEIRMPSPPAPKLTYTPPTPAPGTPGAHPVQPRSACFVATAVFRDADHPTVAALRHWRDTSLASHPPGRMFIRVYALTGPCFAFIVSAIPNSGRWLAPVLAIVARAVARASRPNDS